MRRVSFSLHFPDAERVRPLRVAPPGFYEGALDGLANLRAAGVPFQLHTTVMRANAALLPRMHELVGSSSAPSGWELFFLVPTGRGRRLADEELDRRSSTSACSRWLYRLQRHSPFPVKQICAPHFRRIEVQSARMRGERRPERVTARLTTQSRGCLSGNGFAFVSHVGDVCGCGFLPLSVGNVRDRPFSELYREAPLFQAFRDPARLGGDCGGCEFRAVRRLPRTSVRGNRRPAGRGARLRLAAPRPTQTCDGARDGFRVTTSTRASSRPSCTRARVARTSRSLRMPSRCGSTGRGSRRCPASPASVAA